MKSIDKNSIWFVASSLFFLLALSRCGTESSGGAIVGQQPKPPGKDDPGQGDNQAFAEKNGCDDQDSMHRPSWYYEHNCGPTQDSRLVGSWIFTCDNDAKLKSDSDYLIYSDSRVLSVTLKGDKTCEVNAQDGSVTTCFWTNDWKNELLYIGSNDPNSPKTHWKTWGKGYQFAEGESRQISVYGDCKLSKID